LDGIPKIILGKPKILIDVHCPKCKKLDAIAIPSIKTLCSNCKTEITTGLRINTYYAYAKKILHMVSHHDEIHILGLRDKSEMFTPDDVLSPRSQYEDDIYSTIITIRDDYLWQGNYEVSNVMPDYDFEYKIYCNNCGYCQNCVVCNRCKKHYVPKILKNGQRRYTCPNCGSKSYKQSVVIFKDDGGKIKCPECKSENVVRRKMMSNKKKCPHCDSNNITKPKKIPIYKLVIKRQGRFKMENIRL
jgi:hypothetical protein